ncbi:MAG: hypothetical protein A2Z96_02100 [Spirochaetes bacterium GWB1_48_6]|nr:MAG: hypothetical protein A2Z96_02100 [Spirochaetes bacterium GWB1_48_6]
MSGITIDDLSKLFSNPVFLSGLFAWFSAQFLKAVIEAVRFRNRRNRGLLVTLIWTTGGMPSSHSSVVSALTTAMAFVVGISSPLFILTLFFAILTVRDALGVRRSTGVQARVLNQVMADLNDKLGTNYKSVKEVNGHKAPEVLVGILLGFFLAVAFCSL